LILPCSSVRDWGGRPAPGMNFSPYSDLIPVPMLCSSTQMNRGGQHDISTLVQHINSNMSVIRPRLTRDARKVEERARLMQTSPIIATLIGNIGTENMPLWLANAKARARALLLAHNEFHCNNRWTGRASEISLAVSYFKNPASYAELNMRSYTGNIGGLCAQVEDRWQIVTCIRPEDYAYQKLRVLLGQPLDQTRLITLVSTDLDDPAYAHKSFKTMYKTELEPFLLGLKNRVFKVPTEYIHEMCFVNIEVFEPKGRSLRQRKKEIADFVEGFYDWFAGGRPKKKEEEAPKVQKVEVSSPGYTVTVGSTAGGTITIPMSAIASGTITVSNAPTPAELVVDGLAEGDVGEHAVNDNDNPDPDDYEEDDYGDGEDPEDEEY